MREDTDKLFMGNCIDSSRIDLHSVFFGRSDDELELAGVREDVYEFALAG